MLLLAAPVTQKRGDLGMKLTNREGTPVDPVPFLVIALLSATAAIAWGPVYLLGFDVALTRAVAASVGLAVACVIVTYHRFVWVASPTRRREVPLYVQFRKFLYAIAIGVLLVFALTGLQFL